MTDILSEGVGVGQVWRGGTETSAHCRRYRWGGVTLWSNVVPEVPYLDLGISTIIQYIHCPISTFAPIPEVPRTNSDAGPSDNAAQPGTISLQGAGGSSTVFLEMVLTAETSSKPSYLALGWLEREMRACALNSRGFESSWIVLLVLAGGTGG